MNVLSSTLKTFGSRFIVILIYRLGETFVLVARMLDLCVALNFPCLSSKHGIPSRMNSARFSRTLTNSLLFRLRQMDYGFGSVYCLMGCAYGSHAVW